MDKNFWANYSEYVVLVIGWLLFLVGLFLKKIFSQPQKGLQIESNIEVVDIIISQPYSIEIEPFEIIKPTIVTNNIPKSNQFTKLPLIDIKVRNNSKEVALIKSVEITTLNIWKLEREKAFLKLNVSSYYHCQAPGIGETEAFNLSQQVNSNSVDRFVIVVSSQEGLLFDLSPHLIKLKFYYNEDNKFFETKKLLLHIPENRHWKGCTLIPNLGKPLLENIEKAKQVLRVIDHDTIFCKDTVEALKKWASYEPMYK